MQSRFAGRWVSVPALAAVLVCAGVGDARAGLRGAEPASASSRDFYVSPAGDDSNPGTNPSLPWRTLARVDAADLLPGDRVYLQGSARFDEPLSPYAGAAGTRRLPIVFGSYGRGRATIGGGIYLNSVANLVFRDLRVASPPAKGVFSSSQGTGAQGIVLRDMEISNTPLAGVSSNNRHDAGWVIDRVEISHTGDSGVYFVGSHFTVESSTITHTGRDSRIPYPRHGIYAKGADPTIRANVIRDFSTSGVSLRRQGGLVEGNRVSGGRKGISFDDEATTSGTTRVLCNSVLDVSDSGIALMAAASERFVVAGNTIGGAARNGIYVETVPQLTLVNNTIAARSAAALLNVRSTIAHYREHDNAWSARGSRPVFWNGSPTPFSTYARISGQGRGDVLIHGGLYRLDRRSSGRPACAAPPASATGLFRPPAPATTVP